MRIAVRKILPVVLFGFVSLVIRAQDTVTLSASSHWDSTYKMFALASFYLDAGGNKKIQELVHQPFSKMPDLWKKVGEPAYRHNTVWERWIIKNPLEAPEEIILLFHRHSFYSFYIVDSSGIHFEGNNYFIYTPRTKNERKSFTFTIAGKSTLSVYVEFRGAFRNFSGPEYPVIMRAAELKPSLSMALYNKRYYVFTDVIFLSIILFITIHTLAQYFFSRRKEFVLYAFYAASVFIFFLFKFDDYPYVDTSFAHFPHIQKYGNNVLSYLMYYCYYRFVRSFIDFKAIAPWFYRFILITEKLLLLAIAVDLLIAFSALPSLRSLLFNVLRSYLILMAFTGIFLLFRSRKPLSLFIAVGSGFLITGGLAAMVLSWVLDGPYEGFDPIIYMQLGMVLELLCFTLGLSYKTSLIEKEKRRTQLALIMQLEENRLLQDEMNTQLETRVLEQTEKIMAQQQQLEKEKEQQLMLEFTRKITEMELQLLKSQLNPHFYFNTLNNLYGLAMIAPKKAPDAILKLSDIMEYVIYDCRHDKVPLNKEIKFLQSYVELERLRYENDACISLTIKGEMKNRYISPMLLIQFVENGFKHGMELQKADSYLAITISVESGRLQYESVNSINGLQYKEGGIGLSSIKKRLDMLYPDQHTLDIQSGNGVFKVILDISL